MGATRSQPPSPLSSGCIGSGGGERWQVASRAAARSAPLFTCKYTRHFSGGGPRPASWRRGGAASFRQTEPWCLSGAQKDGGLQPHSRDLAEREPGRGGAGSSLRRQQRRRRRSPLSRCLPAPPRPHSGRYSHHCLRVSACRAAAGARAALMGRQTAQSHAGKEREAGSAAEAAAAAATAAAEPQPLTAINTQVRAVNSFCPAHPGDAPCHRALQHQTRVCTARGKGRSAPSPLCPPSGAPEAGSLRLVPCAPCARNGPSNEISEDNK
ncbi:hypothetical protein NDU88_010275 [Pleurodeles waltl]|uniref:Uncharacterized protein n=1 Tax=Pleurodeles waltl TaxID=8319 RepID=A0AAV7Q1Q9_PLEWA|nr:hypothetical protein NDU88_010275 [Pleurodeles waltl]